MEETRRDFLNLTAVALGVAGTAVAIWPFLDQMNPDADVRSLGGPIDVDLSKVESGQQIKVVWRGKPIYIVNRTKAYLDTLQKKDVIDRLSDPDSKVHQQGEYATNWHRSIKPEYGILVGICTHLGCLPEFRPAPDPSDPAPNWPGGYFCPCHGSKYDLAGRVWQNVPAPYNLPVPPYHFTSDTAIRIGENPPNSTFDFGSIVQV
ncbi:MAG TPA: ubiquinol-cytochrome c reductase iron-sulfur subunit [Alphaproteobacteria bacterium]|nr:ubiquinol-cytochrome c reductase iron-sulfur subunit [Alphaproteobacteria bacterium]